MLLFWFCKRTRVGGTRTAFYNPLLGQALGGTLQVERVLK